MSAANWVDALNGSWGVIAQHIICPQVYQISALNDPFFKFLSQWGETM